MRSNLITLVMLRKRSHPIEGRAEESFVLKRQGLHEKAAKAFKAGKNLLEKERKNAVQDNPKKSRKVFEAEKGIE